MFRFIKSKKIILLSISMICNIFYSSSYYAILDIEITQGVDTAVPVAIYPFEISANNNNNKQNYNKTDLDNISKVISADLYRSGLFLPKQQDNINKIINNLNELPVEKLQNQEVEYIITGNIEVNPYDRYTVSFQLISLYNLLDLNNDSNTLENSRGTEPKEQFNIENNKLKTSKIKDAIILNKSFDISGKYIRNLSHHISDLIYERLTGIKGVFSSKIAYVNVVWDRSNKREYILEIADSDGYNPQKLLVSSEPIMSPTWHPNGKQIAFVSFTGNRSKIKIADLSTGNTRTVTSFKGINGAPAWSPDGTKMALVLSQENMPKIYTLDLSNNKLTRITSGTAIDTEPRWAPDSKSLIFTSSRGGGPQIYSYNFDNKVIKRLTYDGNYNARGSFTPDGSKLVMIHRGEDEKGFNIAVQDLTTYNLDVLTESTMDESPSVSANGQQIIYATKDGEKGILAEVSIDGRVKLKRPATIGDVQEPAWSPYLS